MEIEIFKLPMTDMVSVERELYRLSKTPKRSTEEQDWMDWAEQQLRILHLREVGALA